MGNLQAGIESHIFKGGTLCDSGLGPGTRSEVGVLLKLGIFCSHERFCEIRKTPLKSSQKNLVF